MFGTGRYDIKSQWVVVGFWLVLGRWVDRGSEPAAVCVLGYYRFRWEGEALGLADLKARISHVLTMARTWRDAFPYRL